VTPVSSVANSLATVVAVLISVSMVLSQQWFLGPVLWTVDHIIIIIIIIINQSINQTFIMRQSKIRT